MKQLLSARIRALLLIFLSLPLMTSCSSLSRVTTQSPNETDVSGAGALIAEKHSPLSAFRDPEESFSTLNLCKVYYRYGLASEKDCKLDMDQFPPDPEIRNEVQDLLIAASNQKCGDYFGVLYSMRGDSDVVWGSLATLFSGAAAVVTHGQTASALAAAGAVSSGIGAEVRQAYFANLAIEVVTAGINSRRAEVYEKIETKRGLGAGYSFNGALADALEYHAACKAVVGFEVAAESISRADNPGAKELRRFMDDLENTEVSMGPQDPNDAAPNDPNDPIKPLTMTISR